jgi:hypothetical protein
MLQLDDYNVERPRARATANSASRGVDDARTEYDGI